MEKIACTNIFSVFKPRQMFGMQFCPPFFLGCVNIWYCQSNGLCGDEISSMFFAHPSSISLLAMTFEGAYRTHVVGGIEP